MDLLSSAEVFCETMNERYSHGKESLLIIASDGDKSLLSSFGADEEHIDALSTVIYQNGELFAIIEAALALAITAKIKGCNDTE